MTHPTILADRDTIAAARAHDWWQDRGMSEYTYPDPPPISDWNRLLDRRVAVVTGGASGIGGAISRLFAEHGAHVEILDVDADATRGPTTGAP